MSADAERHLEQITFEDYNLISVETPGTPTWETQVHTLVK